MDPRNGNLESETGDWNAEIKENKLFRNAKIVLLIISFLPLSKKRPSKKDLRLNLFLKRKFPICCNCATVICSEGYDYENLSRSASFIIYNLLLI